MKAGGLIAAVCLAALSAAAMVLVQSRGWTLYYGDAESHLDIARRIVDSRTPGYDQIGTVWLPLPHVLMLPLVWSDRLWRTGVAGALPGMAAFVAGGLFLCAAGRRLWSSWPAAAAACACCVLNPNLLYLQATPMTEPIFFGCGAALLFATVAFWNRPSPGWAAAAGLASLAASLTRYEGWVLIPAVALFLGLAKRPSQWPTLLFGAIAALAPLYWPAHNWWFFGNPLDFYNGPYSAKAIQGTSTYPGLHNWAQAWLYYRSAAILCTGWGTVAIGCAGALCLLWKRLWWPVLLLALPPGFYVWSLYSSGTPIFVPGLDLTATTIPAMVWLCSHY